MTTIEAGKEALWISRFLVNLEYRLPNQPVSLKAYNKRVILLTENPEFHRCNKHIEVQYQQVREKVESKEIVMNYVFSKEMVADGLTKTFDLKQFNAF